MKRSPSIRLKRLDTSIKVPAKTTFFVKGFIRTILNEPVTVELTDATISALEKALSKHTGLAATTAGANYGKKYIEQNRCITWSCSDIFNCFLFVPDMKSDGATEDTKLDASLSEYTEPATPVTDFELTVFNDPNHYDAGVDAVVAGLLRAFGLNGNTKDWLDAASSAENSDRYNGVPYRDAALYGYYTGKRVLELAKLKEVELRSVLLEPLSKVWVPAWAYELPKKPTPPSSTDYDGDGFSNQPSSTLEVIDLDKGTPVHESLKLFATGLMIGSGITVDNYPIALTSGTVDELTVLLQSVKLGFEAYEAGLFYGKYYRTLHPDTMWSLKMLLECQLFNPGDPEYFRLGPMPDFNIYAQELIQQINNWAVNRRKTIHGNIQINPAQWGGHNSFGWNRHQNWPQQSVWSGNDLDDNGFSYIDGLSKAISPDCFRSIAQTMYSSCSAINGLFRATGRVEAWLYGYYTGKRYLQLSEADCRPVLDIPNDPMLNVVWNTRLTDTPRKNNVGGSLEQAIFQYGLNGGEVPMMRIGELPTTRILALLEAGYNSRVNVIGQAPLHDVVEVINKLKSDKQQINQEKV